jgi:hypothetical protein
LILLVPATGFEPVTPKNIAKASHSGSHRDLAACISCDEFVEKLLSAPVDARKIVMNCYAKAWARCGAKAPLIMPTKAKATWDLSRSLAARFPNNDDLAKATGLSVSHLLDARSRFVDKRRDATATLNGAKRL